MRNRFSAHRYRESPEDIAVPVIDAVPLFERVSDRYPGVALSLVVPPSFHWLGQPQYGEDGRAVILDGTCGYAECCGVMARIELAYSTVLWHDFFARGRPDLPRGLRFEFDREEYVLAIGALVDAEPIEWSDELGRDQRT